MVIREIKLQFMVEVSGLVADPGRTLGEGNVGVLKGDATFRGANPLPQPPNQQGLYVDVRQWGRKCRRL